MLITDGVPFNHSVFACLHRAGSAPRCEGHSNDKPPFSETWWGERQKSHTWYNVIQCQGNGSSRQRRPLWEGLHQGICLQAKAGRARNISAGTRHLKGEMQVLRPLDQVSFRLWKARFPRRATQICKYACFFLELSMLTSRRYFFPESQSENLWKHLTFRLWATPCQTKFLEEV